MKAEVIPSPVSIVDVNSLYRNGSGQSKSDDHPLFAFVFVSGLGRALDDFAEADAASGNADFVWVHLDLSDATAQTWLRRRPWPADVIEMVAAPIQRGRLFVAPDMVYGHQHRTGDPASSLSCPCQARTPSVTRS